MKRERKMSYHEDSLEEIRISYKKRGKNKEWSKQREINERHDRKYDQEETWKEGKREEVKGEIKRLDKSERSEMNDITGNHEGKEL